MQPQITGKPSIAAEIPPQATASHKPEPIMSELFVLADRKHPGAAVAGIRFVFLDSVAAITTRMKESAIYGRTTRFADMVAKPKEFVAIMMHTTELAIYGKWKLLVGNEKSHDPPRCFMRSGSTLLSSNQS